MTDVASSVYALLDDASLENGRGERRSRLYTGLARELICSEPEKLDVICAEAAAAIKNGLHAVLLSDYGFGTRLQGVASKQDSGCLRILLFREFRFQTHDETEQWLAREEGGQLDAELHCAGICDVHHGVTVEQYDQAITAIQQWLTAGDCYQINYTYPIHFKAFGTPFALYRRLRAKQPAPYGALIGLRDGSSILSCSPELFLKHEDRRLTAQPMKGTAAAGSDEQETQNQMARLLNDPKNRAENLMIVDLLRNDLGRVAETGTVKVPTLFAVERFGDVLQMTSTVEAKPQSEIGLAEVLRALFPCGSITGAPKFRAMQRIDQIEANPRGLYTGTIGWFDQPLNGETLGPFCFSVAIRTLELSAPTLDGTRLGCMGVGGGIVTDSQASAEYAECALKARFLTGLDPGFQLFETIYATRAGCRHLSRHLARLKNSAEYFGFVYDESAIRLALESTCAELDDQGYRLRLSLSKDGTLKLTHAVLQAVLQVSAEPVQLLVADQPIDSRNLFLHHKTTLRSRYDRAWQQAEQQGAFDTLFFNERGELTEGARSNIFIQRNGIWATPPVSCGLLPGVMRAVLLDDPVWKTEEAVLNYADLMAAEAIMVCNALRGVLPAMLKK